MENRTERRTITPTGSHPEGFGAAQAELVPGYILEERIGSGGFGEVWRAVAPGGLLKAVKIVYGGMADRHASAELKSLERIKSVRHPFILTLERIDVVDGRLIIISELAECSLQDYFLQLTSEGSEGIDRSQLLRFMHDIADALDHMSQQHSLQHLDIKPENLLLIGGHVKVADFGLTKDLRDASLSAVGGMTPAYTAPEVFAGNPGRFSDQYSLACVYQFLLTGKHPFQGQSTAELVSQHLHSAADISPLPFYDQSVVLRALSKSPRRRFSCSGDFVQALVEAGETKKRPAPKAGKIKDAGSISDSQKFSKVETVSNSQFDSKLLEDPSLERLGALSDRDLSNVMRPTLVIGLGGMATSVLRSLKTQLERRLPTGQTPAFRLLAIDTDENALLASVYESKSDRLNWSQCLPIRLKTSADYHSRSRDLVSWISRRWLFNIPRSRQTQGIRALGRLAFIDHYREIERVLRRSLTEITDDETVQQTADAAGFTDQSAAPRVFVVSSTSGGTGSGMVLDMGYVVRGILRSMSLPDEGVTGILLHDVHGTANRGGIYSANALACIRELNYYCREQHYYGDESSGIPPVEKARPFETAYVVPLTRPTGGSAARGATEVVAEYLFQSFAGSCTDLFDHLRATASPGDLMPKVKSIAVEKLVIPGTAVETVETPPSEPAAAGMKPKSTENADEDRTETDLDREIPHSVEDDSSDVATTVIETADLDAGFEQIEMLLQEAGEPPLSDGEAELDSSGNSSPETPTIVNASSPPTKNPTAGAKTRNNDSWELLQRGDTEVLSFSADALFEHLWKTRGNVRMIVAASEDAVSHYQPTFGGLWFNQFTHLPSDADTAFVCFEVDGIPLCDVTASIESVSRRCGELADQLSTRIDIDWTS